MNKEEIKEALEIIKEPITVNCIDYKYFTQEQYNKLVSVYENAQWLIDLLEKTANQLETNIEEALKTTKELYEEGVEWHWDNGILEMYVLDLLSILERGKE